MKQQIIDEEKEKDRIIIKILNGEVIPYILYKEIVKNSKDDICSLSLHNLSVLCKFDIKIVKNAINTLITLKLIEHSERIYIREIYEKSSNIVKFVKNNEKVKKTVINFPMRDHSAFLIKAVYNSHFTPEMLNLIQKLKNLNFGVYNVNISEYNENATLMVIYSEKHPKEKLIIEFEGNHSRIIEKQSKYKDKYLKSLTGELDENYNIA